MAPARFLVAFSALGLSAVAAAGGLLPQASAGSVEALLPVDQAFMLDGAHQRGGTVQLGFTIAPGYYLYARQFKVRVESPTGQPLPALTLPKGETRQDAEFGEVMVYRESVSLRFAAGTSVPRTLRVSYQGCADVGVCYPPQTRLVAVQS
jgi:thioredoxin:protein disulfide reductase